MGALLTGGVRNPNHQVSTATAAITRMPPPQSIGFLSLGDGEMGSGSTGKVSTGMGFVMGVTGTGCAGRDGGARAREGARAEAIDASDSVGAAADGTTGSGVALVGWPQDLQNFASVARGA